MSARGWYHRVGHLNHHLLALIVRVRTQLRNGLPSVLVFEKEKKITEVSLTDAKASSVELIWVVRIGGLG